MVNAHAFTGLEIPYLIEILSENVKRYEQLKQVIKQGEDSESLLRLLNEGIDNASGLLQSLPVESNGVLKGLEEFKYSMNEAILLRQPSLSPTQ